MDIKKRFGKRVKELRHARGLSQDELAHLAGVDTTYITDIEKGEMDVSIEIIQKLSVALQISIGDLLKDLELFEVP